MMQRHPKQSVHVKQTAFSLVELIAVTVVIAIVVGLGVAGLTTVVTGLHGGRQMLERTQKAQVAMQRIVLELRFVEAAPGTGTPQVTVTPDGQEIAYQSKKDSAFHTIKQDGTLVTYDGHTLTDDVEDFLVESVGDVLRVTLTLADAGQFSVEVFP